ncbi:MAG: gliding motility protein GldM [Cytophagales bacterium]|nr:MAG: gliding motility protein GldM [Cytophagales bacterium]
MAGGAKETPRQKMVGMMYLVLTAMLALQVSSSIMDKFIFLNDSLEHAYAEAEKTSKGAVAALEKQVAKEGNAREGLERVKRAKELRAKTEALIKKMEAIKQELITAGDGPGHGGHGVKNPKEETKVEVLMVGPEGSKSGKGYTLEKDLNDYVKYLNTQFKDMGITNLSPLAIGNENKAYYADDAVQRNKDFAQASFQSTPVVAALAIVTQLENEVLKYEQEVLKKLGAGDFGRELKFDKIEAVVAVESSVLAPGDEFKAKLYLSAAASNAKMQMFFNGAAVQMKEGVGVVTQRVAGGAGEVPWEGKIIFNNRGKDTTFVVKGKYKVISPELTVVPKGANLVMYQNCFNEWAFLVPALGASYDPSFSATNGARIIKGGSSDAVTIVPPNLGKVTVAVSQNGTQIGARDFDVKPTPPPTLVLVNPNTGAEIDESSPVPLSVAVMVKAKPDPNFFSLLPKECNYQITGMEVAVIKGGDIAKKQQFPGSTLNLSSLGLKKGDGVTIKVNSVLRTSPSGGTETVNITKRSLAFNVR